MYIYLIFYRIYFMKRNNDKFLDKFEISGIENKYSINLIKFLIVIFFIQYIVRKY